MVDAADLKSAGFGHMGSTPVAHTKIMKETKMKSLEPALSLDSENFKIEPCGSRVTCNPPVLDTDQDYLIEILNPTNTKISDAVGWFHIFDFKFEGGEHYQVLASGSFMSFRKKDINLIVTANPEFARKHRLATKLCTQYNLLKKTDRIALFQAILYGNDWQPMPEGSTVKCP